MRSLASARLFRLAASIPIVAAFAGCARDDSSDAQSSLTTVTIFAAASTGDALKELVRQFEAEHPGTTITLSLGSSAALAQQIEAGAAADLFLSASRSWMKHLEERGMVRRSQPILGNELVVVVPQASSLELREPKDLLDAKVARLALADPESVPAGTYARQALTKLDLWDSLRSKVAGAADVRQALMFVETAAAEAGIVYASDACASTKTKVAFRLPPELSDPIAYPLIELKRNANKSASEFYDFLTTPAALQTFTSHGFLPPPLDRT